MVQQAALGEAERALHRHQHQQQRQADHHLGHHQRRIDHAAEQRAAGEAPVLDQRERRQRAQHHRAAGGQERDLQAQPQAVDQLGVARQLRRTT
jgi:hypothetical protein